MEIIRNLDEKEYVIKLTDDELIDAYFEQQSKFDEEDVLNISNDLSTKCE